MDPPPTELAAMPSGHKKSSSSGKEACVKELAQVVIVSSIHDAIGIAYEVEALRLGHFSRFSMMPYPPCNLDDNIIFLVFCILGPLWGAGSSNAFGLLSDEEGLVQLVRTHNW